MTVTKKIDTFESADIKTLFYNVLHKTDFPDLIEVPLIKLKNEILNINH